MKRTIGQVIEGARKSLGLTQLELASSAGVKEVCIAHLERGYRHPSLQLLGRLGNILELDTEALFLAYPDARQLIQNRSPSSTDAWRIRQEQGAAGAPSGAAE
jgi:DNA-binding XRE family transcriptional regulator